MGLDEWEILDCHEDGEKKLSSANLSVDQQMASDLNDTDRCIGVQADEDTVSQVSGQKLIGHMKKESARFCSGAESDAPEEVEGKEEGINSKRMNMAMEKRQKWGRAAICSFGIAVAATICTVLLGSHSHSHSHSHLQWGANKQPQKNQICPCE